MLVEGFCEDRLPAGSLAMIISEVVADASGFAIGSLRMSSQTENTMTHDFKQLSLLAEFSHLLLFFFLLAHITNCSN